MAKGTGSPYSRLQVDSKANLAAWPTSWWPPGDDRLSLRGPKVNSRIWLCAVDDNTVNIILYIIIINMRILCFLYPVVCADAESVRRGHHGQL